jgi:hypothetical protein
MMVDCKGRRIGTWKPPSSVDRLECNDLVRNERAPVVTRDVPPWAVVVGVPARLLDSKAGKTLEVVKAGK